jgi:hypothetical protein
LGRFTRILKEITMLDNPLTVFCLMGIVLWIAGSALAVSAICRISGLRAREDRDYHEMEF